VGAFLIGRRFLMAIVVYDGHVIGALAHFAWWLLQLDHDDPRRPDELDYDTVMKTFRALHMGQISAFTMDNPDPFILRSYDPGFLRWFERPGPDYTPAPPSIGALVEELEEVKNAATTEEGIVMMPALYRRHLDSIITYGLKVESGVGMEVAV
jgi:hypothetical protein